ncbi:uncharacterized GMC-type oxidoreductase Mb1310-like [Argopecten irradians]|uniref:uncharacterized GMC-type oxidoreductase Mb1310-like n=1 Tax=Argopecten irradians TaxID=31199 RepID=UPI00371DF249
MAINSMVYQRGSPEIFNHWAEKGARGWSYNEVEQYFERMENVRLHEPHNEAKRGNCGPVRVTQNKLAIFRDLLGNASAELGYRRISCNEGVDEGFCPLQITTKSGERWNTAKAYLAPVMGRKNLHLLTDSAVVKILLYQGTAVGVEFRTKDGKTKRAFTRKEVIVSAGVYNTPKLLLLSGIGPREHLKDLQIPVMSNVPVGLDLKELPVVPLRIYTTIRTFRPELLVEPRNTLAYITNRTGLLSEMSPMEGLLFAKTSLESPDWPDINLYFISTLFDRLPEVLRGWNIKQELISTWFREGLGHEGIQIMAQLIHPYSRGRVALRSDDPMDPPLIDPGFLTDTRDIRELIKAVRLINELVNTRFLRGAGAVMDNPFPDCNQFTYNTTDYWECYIRYFAIANFHGTGTVKMGAVKDNSAVLDPELRVKGIHGLRVVGSAVMPEPTEDQTAAVIMIAERASDLIKLAAGIPVGDAPLIPNGRPLNRGPPLGPLNKGPHRVPMNQRPPLVPMNKGQPHGPMNQGPPPVQMNQGHIGPVNRRKSLGPVNQGPPSGHPINSPHNSPDKPDPLGIQTQGLLSNPQSHPPGPLNTPPRPASSLISSSNQQEPILHNSIHEPLDHLTR